MGAAQPMERANCHPGVEQRTLAGPVEADLSRRETDPLLVAAGRGDLDAFAVFYDRTAGTVFGQLRRALGVRAELATKQVYVQMWRAAPAFDPTGTSAYAVLLATTRRVLARLLVVPLPHAVDPPQGERG